MAYDDGLDWHALSKHDSPLMEALESIAENAKGTA